MAQDPLQQITDSLVADLEAVIAGDRKRSPFSTPWAKAGFPANALTGAEYNGLNTLILWHKAKVKGYSNNKWVTFKQIKMIEGGEHAHVRKGEKATVIVRYVSWVPRSFGKIDNDTYIHKTYGTTHSKDEATMNTLRAYNVFNVEQVVDLPDEYYKLPDQGATLTNDELKWFVAETGAMIEHGGDRAFFNYGRDRIGMPRVAAFNSEDHYWGILFHELGHWTGHKSRLDRPLSQEKNLYAFEELVAEITSAFLSSRFGLKAEMQHVEYLEGYVKALKEDATVLRKAAAASQKAFDYLIGAGQEEQEQAA